MERNKTGYRLAGGLIAAFLSAELAYLLACSFIDIDGLWQSAKADPLLGLLVLVPMTGGALLVISVATGLAGILGGVLGAVFAPRAVDMSRRLVTSGLQTGRREENDVRQEWKAVGVVFEGQHVLIDGCNPWGLDWKKLDADPLDLSHPNYPDQLHKFTIYRLPTKDRDIEFAAAEVSPRAWAFYQYKR